MHRRPAQASGGIRLWLALCLGFAVAMAGIAGARAQAPADPRLASPRATVRTLLTTITTSHANPALIRGAIATLDLGDAAADLRVAALLATQLEAVLRARDLDTDLLPDKVAGDRYVLPDWHGQKIALQRTAAGNWLFDRETVSQIPRFYAEAQGTLQDRYKDAAALGIAPRYASPRATLRTLVISYRKGDLEHILGSMDLAEIPLVAREEVGDQLANKLKQILVRQPRIILQDVPDHSFGDPYVLVAQPEGVIELARQDEGPRKGEWLFSRDTVRSIGNLYAAFESRPYSPELVASGAAGYLPGLWSEPELWLRSHLPAALRAVVVGDRYNSFEAYELLGYLIVPVIAWIVFRASLALLVFAGGLARGRFGIIIEAPALRRGLRPVAVVAALCILRRGILLLAPDPDVLVPFLTVVNPLIWVIAMWAIANLVDMVGLLIENRIVAERRSAEITQMVWPIGSLALKIALAVITVFHLVGLFAWDLSTVLAGLGIGGLAVALGAQDVLKNLFGSLTLIADRPFLVGEMIRIGERQVGVVEAVGLRSTRIRTADDTLLIVPNSNLTTVEITNFGRRRYRRFAMKLAVAHTTPRDQILALRDGVMALLQASPAVRRETIEVSIDDLAGGKVALGIEAYLDVADRAREIIVRDGLFLDVLKLAGDSGVALT